MNLIQVLSNPIKLQIMQFLQERESATTKQISEKLSDVPVPTLYRHINEMIKTEFLIVKEENRIRGSVERVLALNTDVIVASEHDDVAGAAYQFLMGLYMQFRYYCDKQKVDPIRDMLMMRTCMLKLDDEKYMELLEEWAQLIEKYKKDAGKGKNRCLSLISAPVE